MIIMPTPVYAGPIDATPQDVVAVILSVLVVSLVLFLLFKKRDGWSSDPFDYESMVSTIALIFIYVMLFIGAVLVVAMLIRGVLV